MFEDEIFYARQSEYNGQVFDSKTEAIWAAYFDRLGMSFVREPETFRLDIVPGLADIYTPDFFLPNQSTYVEVKNGNLDSIAITKMCWLTRFTRMAGLIIDGRPNSATIYVYTPNNNPHLNRKGYYYEYVYTRLDWWPCEYMQPDMFNLAIDAMKYAKQNVTTNVQPDLIDKDAQRHKLLRSSPTVFSYPED